MSHKEHLGTYLKHARMTSGLTLRAVERETGISNGYLSQLESGRVRRPSPDEPPQAEQTLPPPLH